MKNNVKVQDDTQSLQSCVSVSVTDLRIGNLLHYNGNHKEVGKVTLLVSYMINELSYCQLDHRRNKKHWLINLDGILLTEQWHNNFGVKKNGFNSFEYKIKNKFNLYLTVFFTGDYVMIRQGEKKSIDDDMISVWNKDLTKRDMYVHEWQNLYFSLSGSNLIECVLTEH